MNRRMPNGTYGGNDLPTFKDVAGSDRKKFEAVQFDPDSVRVILLDEKAM